MRKYRKWRDILIEQLAADPTAAIGFLQAVMEGSTKYSGILLL